MPELPEVETTCNGIRPWVEGARIRAVVTRNGALRRPVPSSLGETLMDRTVLAVRRRAKYVVLDFDGGCVLIHLGMSGSLRLVDPSVAPLAHDHVDLVLSGGVLRYRDPRRFGLILWHPDVAESHPLLAELGPEPLGPHFDGDWLYQVTRRSQVAVKQALMDARKVVGVGNIYASESLFRAGINPFRPAGRIGLSRYRRLAGQVRDTLQEAIAAGGSTLRDFVGGDGLPGYFQHQTFAYGRAAQPCRVCGALIQRAVIAQRASYWCPVCQKR